MNECRVSVQGRVCELCYVEIHVALSVRETRFLCVMFLPLPIGHTQTTVWRSFGVHVYMWGFPSSLTRR